MIVAKVNTEFWFEDSFVELSKLSRYVFAYLLISPQRRYISVFRWNKNYAMLYTGLTIAQLDEAVKELESIKYVEVYDGYIGIISGHALEITGPYGAINVARDKEKLPDRVLSHFFPKYTKAKAKPGPKADTLDDVIIDQPAEVRRAITDFVEDRKERKRPPTSRAVKGWLKKLEELAPRNPRKQVKIIEQSIERGWMGLFELKDDDQPKKFV